MVVIRHCESREATSAKEVPERLVVIGRHFRHAVPCFPTLSEVWLNLLEAYRAT